jgi:thioesterase domain-containing protein
VHGAPGSGFAYADLASCFAPDQPFYAFQAHGLDGRNAPLSSIEEMAAAYIDAIRTVQPYGPYLLGGHSLGGFVAFEMARQLLAAKSSVALLAILDSGAPLFKSESPGELVSNETALAARFVLMFSKAIARFTDVPMPVWSEALSEIPEAERLELLRAWLVKLNALPRGAGLAQVVGRLRVLQANIRAHRRYTAEPQDVCEIVLFRSRDLHPDEMANDRTGIAHDPTYRWSRFTSSPIVTHVVPGDHITMLRPPNVAALAAALSQTIEHVQAITIRH